MGRFVASPDELNKQGEVIIENAEKFRKNVEDMYSSIDKMVHSSYLSPEAVAIANEIAKYREDLNYMQKTIENYGTFCKNASTKVMKNQDDIISSI